jgi:hypothetical protein
MLTRTKFACLALGLAAGLWLTGCNGSNPPANNAAPGTSGGGHTHTHLGPHKGHVMVLGKEEYHAEWTHTEEGKVTFYILDAAAEKEVPIEAKEITIDVKIGQNPPTPFTLAAANPVDGKTAAFEITDPNLESALHVNINGKQFDQEIKEEEHTDEHKH